VTALFDAHGITKRFGGLVAINRVDYALDRGISSIIGPNGAGKTTLFNVFTGLYEPDAGEVTFRGHSLVGLRPDQITALGVCRTFQNIRLFANMTAIENVLVGMHARVRLGLWDALTHPPRFHTVERGLWQRGSELLERVGLRDKANEVARNLPYGDQRRLELARALGSEPALLLLDEPTAGMSPEETDETMRLIRQHARGRTIVLVEHKMKLVMNISDVITVLHQGRVLAEGTPEEIRASTLVQQTYLGVTA
jgi:branched-chain amino acid transport system ATP-binding protein